jgi:hypothetical protein
MAVRTCSAQRRRVRRRHPRRTRVETYARAKIPRYQLLGLFRSRASLQIEILALRHVDTRK